MSKLYDNQKPLKADRQMIHLGSQKLGRFFWSDFS